MHCSQYKGCNQKPFHLVAISCSGDLNNKEQGFDINNTRKCKHDMRHVTKKKCDCDKGVFPFGVCEKSYTGIMLLLLLTSLVL